MLTDIFAQRYAATKLWDTFREPDRRFLVQAFKLIKEDLLPYYDSKGYENPVNKAKWKDIHDKLARELGLASLSPTHYSYQTMWNGKQHTQSGAWGWDYICQNFVCAPFGGSVDADTFMKDRISFIELAFRSRDIEIASKNADLPKEVVRAMTRAKDRNAFDVLVVPGDPVEGVKAWNRRINEEYQRMAEELNARLRQAGYKLSYHGGFIQRTDDALVAAVIEEPFWALVAAPQWSNVSTDMKEALDRRDNGGRDAAFYAARALESTIKIVSDAKGLTIGNEKGAHNYIDNIGSARGNNFIKDWEATALKQFFSQVRNPLGHGPGNNEMPNLTPEQTNWAIENCMSWIKSLIERM